MIFAEFVLVAAGCTNAIHGPPAVPKHMVDVVPSSNRLMTTNSTTWGWTLLIRGSMMALAGPVSSPQ